MSTMRTDVSVITIRRFFAIIILILSLAIGGSAQTAATQIVTSSPEVTITLHHQHLRFTAPSAMREMRLEIHNQSGKLIYDSGSVAGAELQWALQNSSGGAIPTGLYSYTLTLKKLTAETPRQQRGRLLVERAQDQSGDHVRVTAQSAGAARADIADEAMLAVVNGSGTPGRLAKWIAGDTIGNSLIVDTGNTIGIGPVSSPDVKLFVQGSNLWTIFGENTSGGGVGIRGTGGTGVQGTGIGTGVSGSSYEGVGVLGIGKQGVRGEYVNFIGSGPGVYGVTRSVDTNAVGVYGEVSPSLGLPGRSAAGVKGEIKGASEEVIGGAGVSGVHEGAGVGVLGETNYGIGVRGVSQGGRNSLGVHGYSLSPNGLGVLGVHLSPTGVAAGVLGGTLSADPDGVAVYGVNYKGYAGYFQGNLHTTGTLSKAGGSFKIDHPLDPANKYLSHSFVESPDMMNIYNGNVTTDANGEAVVELPAYFEALNRDFRYQLTVLGQFARATIASEIVGNRFTIKTDRSRVKVSWQVTGVRRDAWANAHRIPVEEKKPQVERGSYLHPQLFGQPEEKNVEWARHPEMMRQMKQQREQMEKERSSSAPSAPSRQR
ncbi:MAG TPA: hypothetical protein VJ810_30460 [Blastocatellia bacterium]|nr:hypothetical protein [Blastocatellia bacterium]